jgi:hypothetical protein
MQSAGVLASSVQSVAVLGHESIAALHRFADLAADQIRAALHARIDEGPRPDW